MADPKKLEELSPEELIERLKASEAKNVAFENSAKESKAAAAVAKKESGDKDALIADMQAKMEAAVTNATETAAVTTAQMKYHGKKFDATVKHTATITIEEKKTKVGFLPGIHKLRIPGFDTAYANVKQEDGTTQQVPIRDGSGAVYIDSLIEHFPKQLQKLFDNKVNIFKNLETGQAYF